jgi:hypothetical protein
MRKLMPRFERLDASTLGFPSEDPRIAVTVLTPRIVRVELTQIGRDTAPSYLADREWTPPPFDVVDGEPVRLVTIDLRVEVSRAPLRVAVLDSRDGWLLRRRPRVFAAVLRYRGSTAPGRAVPSEVS